MILADVNLLVYVVNTASPFHRQAGEWWQTQLGTGDVVCVSWTTLYGFLRTITNPRAVPRPLLLQEATGLVEEWLTLPQVRIIQQTPSHFDHLKRLLSGITATPKLITDAHFAALAIEHDCELHTADGDFAKFSGLRWRNPLTGTAGPAS